MDIQGYFLSKENKKKKFTERIPQVHFGKYSVILCFTKLFSLVYTLSKCKGEWVQDSEKLKDTIHLIFLFSLFPPLI